MDNVTAVIFDLGRVMVDIVFTGHKFGALTRAAGDDPAEMFARFGYSKEVRQHMMGEIDSIQLHASLRDKYGVDVSYEDFAEGWCDLFQVKDDVVEIFTQVAAHRRVGILSDTDSLHWARIKTMLPCLDMVEKPTLSFEVGFLKPHREMYAAAARDCGAKEGNCLFIDDILGNVDGARFCGMPALHFSGAEKLAKDLTMAGIIA